MAYIVHIEGAVVGFTDSGILSGVSLIGETLAGTLELSDDPACTLYSPCAAIGPLKIGEYALVLSFGALPAQVLAQSLDIKGVRIGMTEAEVKERIGNIRDFTVAGVPGKFPHQSVAFKYMDGKLVSLVFFEPKNFTQIYEALKEKYLALRCESSTVSNAMGASFEQTKCNLDDSEDLLSLNRFTQDIRTSSLSLMSKRALEEAAQKRKTEAKKDI